MRVRLLVFGRLLDLVPSLTLSETANDQKPIFVSLDVRVVHGLQPVDDFLQVVDDRLPIATVDIFDHLRPAFLGDHGPTDAFERRAGGLGRPGGEGQEAGDGERRGERARQGAMVQGDVKGVRHCRSPFGNSTAIAFRLRLEILRPAVSGGLPFRGSGPMVDRHLNGSVQYRRFFWALEVTWITPLNYG